MKTNSSVSAPEQQSRNSKPAVEDFKRPHQINVPNNEDEEKKENNLPSSDKNLAHQHESIHYIPVPIFQARPGSQSNPNGLLKEALPPQYPIYYAPNPYYGYPPPFAFPYPHPPIPIQIPYGTYSIMPVQPELNNTRPIISPISAKFASLPLLNSESHQCPKPVIHLSDTKDGQTVKNQPQISSENNKESNVQPDLPNEDDKEDEESASEDLGSNTPGSGTYKHRNVFKSIIRHMHSVTRKQRTQLVGILLEAGFLMPDIEHAFYEIGCYNDMERQKGKKKISQSLVRRISTDKSIFTYILRETLGQMLSNWDQEKYGRLTKKNVGTYRDVCLKYFKETLTALGKPCKLCKYDTS